MAALSTAGLTFFSGFGLGTILMPVFALSVPVLLAIAAKAVVHLANNLLNLGLMAGRADRRVVARSGMPADGLDDVPGIPGPTSAKLLDHVAGLIWRKRQGAREGSLRVNRSALIFHRRFT